MTGGMKRAAAAALGALLLVLSACGESADPSAVPESSAPASGTAAPEAAATPSPTEAPGAGRLRVHMTQQTGDGAFRAAVPVLSITGRPEAESAVNQALASQAGQEVSVLEALAAQEGCQEGVSLCRVERGDNRVLSLVFCRALYRDGVCQARQWTASVFDTLAGQPVSFSALAREGEDLEALCLAYLAEVAPEEDLSAGIQAGSWYLSGEGLTVLLPVREGDTAARTLCIPYGVLAKTLRDDWMPPEQETVSGGLTASYSTQTDTAGLTMLDELTLPGGLESVILQAQGTVRNLRACWVEPEDDGGFAETEELWYCSRLENNEAVRFNVTVPEGVPNLKFAWITDQGLFEALLSWNGQTGNAELLYLTGSAVDGVQEEQPNDGPYSFITVDALLGYWTNEAPGRRAQALSLNRGICYVWHGERQLEGSGFAWELVYRDEEGQCPLIVIHTGGAEGDLLYPVDRLDETTFHCSDTGQVFTRPEAVG